VLDVARQAVEAAKAAGADYADGRVVAEEAESLTVRNQEMEGIDRSSDGMGPRLVVNATGFRRPPGPNPRRSNEPRAWRSRSPGRPPACRWSR
jgi:predicted Zn-dependent protease